MSKLNFSGSKGKSKFNRFLSSKGFYVALAVCLVGASAATWTAVNRTISSIEDSNKLVLEEGFDDFPLLEEAEKKQEDVPKVTIPEVSQYSAPESSSTAPASSTEQSEEVFEPSEQSDAQVSSPVLPTLAYALPISNGEITAHYSNGELVKNVTLNDWRTHDGVDFVCDKGEDVYAAADGVVVDVVNDPLWGTTVSIRHADNNVSIYCGLDSNVSVQPGENVLVKQVIGQVDGVPCELDDGVHIHFAMQNDGKWIDPLSVMSQTGGGETQDVEAQVEE